jgi:uncharacterized protein YnzC (UPF0291/DUF896 family)
MGNIKYPHYLSTIFNVNFINNNANIIRARANKVLETVGFPVNKKSKLINIYNRVYKCLLENYRNEYVFKNTIVNKILLEKHSPATSAIFSEFQVLGCKLDLLVLNGTSKAYEIKTKYDNFTRLEMQLETYLKFFDEVYLVLDEQIYDEDNEILGALNDRIGILVFTQKNELIEKKKAESNTKYIKSEDMVALLRKDEYLDIIKSSFSKDLSDTPNTKMYGEARQWFSKFEGQQAHQLTIEKLKLRKKYIEEKRRQIEKSQFDSVRNLLVNSTNEKDLNNLLELFQQ